MKYFLTVKDNYPSYTYEFQKGKWEEPDWEDESCWSMDLFWKEDSLLLDDDVLFENEGFADALYGVLKDFNSFNEVSFTVREWEEIFKRASQADNSSEEMALEANQWMKEAFAEYEYVTIIGV